MNRIVSYIFVFVILSAFSTLSAQEQTPLTVNLFTLRNGKGLETDQKVLKGALEKLGYQVQCLEHCHSKDDRHNADVNIFFELINPEMLSWGRLNWFIPNPEWYRQDLALMDKCDLILCRTKEVERIFGNLNKKTYFLGFSSPDSYQSTIQKDYTRFLHVAGGSNLKGTAVLLKVWRQHTELPSLTVVKHHETPVLTQ